MSREGITWPPRSDDDYQAEALEVLGPELAERFARVKLLVLDADGVMTSGKLIYGPEGEALKEFHAHDGLGLVLGRLGDLKLAVLTGRNSKIVGRRCTELRFDSIKLGRFDKLAALEEIFAETGCAAEEALYVGDDLIDLPAMQVVGVAVTVPDCAWELEEFCDYITVASGGAGAVREVVELTLKAGGRFGQALVRLLEKEWQPTRAELTDQPHTGKEGEEVPPEMQ
jgi:3-deoxy-D-manno-octulosonate 8-phosphate phosphatase (KDO 8-P phosphatase)